MPHYGEFLRGLKQATTFRRRRGSTEPRLGQEPPHAERIVRAGPRRKPDRAGGWRRFHRLAWPGYFTFGIGTFLHAGRLVNPVWQAKMRFEFFVALWIAVCLVFAARALFAVERSRRLRLAAGTVNLLYPLHLILLIALGV